MNIKEFKNKTLKEKVNSVIDLNKQKLIISGKIDNNIYLIDDKEKLRIIPVSDIKYLKDAEYMDIFRGIIKSIILDFNEKNIKIKHLFYLKNSYFDFSYTDYPKLNLDNSFSSENGNECLLVYFENKLSMRIEVYDKITGIDNGEKYSVLSKKPLKKLEYSKLDPDKELGGILTNIIR